MLGTTANAMAVMRALVEGYGPAPRAFLVAPIVGAFFIDFTNALIITLFLNVLAWATCCRRRCSEKITCDSRRTPQGVALDRRFRARPCG
jgi:hypothetical protein